MYCNYNRNNLILLISVKDENCKSFHSLYYVLYYLWYVIEGQCNSCECWYTSETQALVQSSLVCVLHTHRHILAYMKECLEDPLSQEDDPLEEPEQTKKLVVNRHTCMHILTHSRTQCDDNVHIKYT